MSQAPEKITTPERVDQVAVAETLPAADLKGLVLFDVRSRHTVQGLIPQAELGSEKVVFKGSPLPTVSVVEDNPPKPGRPTQAVYDKTKVGAKEGFYQSAERITGSGYTHQERLALAHALKAQYAEETNTLPSLKGRKADGSDMRVRHQLLREDNFDAVMEKLKKANPKLAEKVIETLTKKENTNPPGRDPYGYSGSPEGPQGTINPPTGDVPPPPRPRIIPQPGSSTVVNPGDNPGRSGEPAPGGEVLPHRLPAPEVPQIMGRVIRTKAHRDQIWLQQTNSYGCAAFSLAMALADMQGRRPSPAEANRLENTPVAGTTIARAGQFPGQLSDMTDLARRSGLNARDYGYGRVGPQTLNDLNAELDKGHSALVRVINPTTGNNHWVYAVGRTPDGRYVIADPSRRNNQVGGPHHEPLSATQLLRAMNRGGAGFVAVWGSADQVARRAGGNQYIARR